MEALIQSWLQRHPEVLFATLFGSFSKGRERPDSDVDVAVLTAHPLSPEERVDLAQDLATAVQREVDLVDFSQAAGSILREALTRSKILINRDPIRAAALMKRFLLDEADFGPLRERALAERRRRVLKTHA